jgi:hypothetical protein
MTSISDYKVSVGRIARTLIYEDSQGTILFTFDVDADPKSKSVILERKGKSLIEAEQLRINMAFERTKEYLLSCGYQVEIFDG